MKKIKHKIKFRIPFTLHQLMLEDLRKPHSFAFERIGFLFTKTIFLPNNEILILATDYSAVADEDYIDDSTVGARINGAAIRKAMQYSIDMQSGCFHIHLHAHKGKPSPSFTDIEGFDNIIGSLANVAKHQACGAMIVSNDSFYTQIKLPDHKSLLEATTVAVVGYPFSFQFLNSVTTPNRVLDRQSFLGEKSQSIFENIKVGIIGYGGGGSHIGLQLAHIGVKNIVVFDDDIIEETNLNRLVGAGTQDVENNSKKVDIARRVIENVLPAANVESISSRWQHSPTELQSCDIIVGCVDSFSERQQLEGECRRNLIPLIDIGMDVHKNDIYSISGQIILSTPGMPCMSCFGFLTEEKLAIEAGKYGNVGGRPQVVWPNGVLASTAVGILIELLTGWTNERDKIVYLSYDGNSGEIRDHIRKKFAPKECCHYPLKSIGSPKYIKL